MAQSKIITARICKALGSLRAYSSSGLSFRWPAALCKFLLSTAWPVGAKKRLSDLMWIHAMFKSDSKQNDTIQKTYHTVLVQRDTIAFSTIWNCSTLMTLPTCHVTCPQVSINVPSFYILTRSRWSTLVNLRPRPCLTCWERCGKPRARTWENMEKLAHIIILQCIVFI